MQKHLNKERTVNLGSFYTPTNIVQKAYELLQKRVNLKDFLLFDSACGYGDFFIGDYQYLGADIDEIALQKVNSKIRTIATNSLLNVSRSKFGIPENENLIIIGNPPYNDKTSIINNGIKRQLFDIDKNLAHRDLGISFLRSFALLNPGFICVLHPLSYLIKESNFKALKLFKECYALLEDIIISSEIFTPHSKTFFPIIIALYIKDNRGMDYDFIKNYQFSTDSGKKLRLNDFDFIGNYVLKYPNPKDKRKEIAYFHTLRDINALKRNQTFMTKCSANSIRVFQDNIQYYYYIHHFKKFADKLPYYFGNLDIFINHEEFLKISDAFMDFKTNACVQEYFEKLFKELA
ncbi:hypothetical protein CQA66_05375 [Helicobacter aurati]|uniref:DNA methylase adenine-specific domain-containing protein n=1 Tax=Helicobacter aurati TaxID=137778 RepID=A0A3D8J543_9HELI|nr:N-6 DNA methylase [Helicobacter aurati]RDU72306.1 hypothetical protein CQA66_05375 [Helicobacter aurati]